MLNLLDARHKVSVYFAYQRKMADEALAKAYGLHFDELNKIRILEPDVAQQTNELKEECKDFVDSKYKINL